MLISLSAEKARLISVLSDNKNKISVTMKYIFSCFYRLLRVN